MSLDLRELYQEIIIDHNRNPRNHYAMESATTSANGFNPLCGDKLTVYIEVNNDLLKKISFVGCGCAISQASASLMTETLSNKTLQEAHSLFHHFHQTLTSDEKTAEDLPIKLQVLTGVKAYPARVKCATLAWHTLEAALNRNSAPVTTE